MIPVTTFRGASVAVFGLGGSGLATCAALARVAPASSPGMTIRPPSTRPLPPATRPPTCAPSPGPASRRGPRPRRAADHPAPHWSVGLARAHGVEVLGDIELFCRERRATAPLSPFVAITGTNGKSTTTALVTHILAATGRDPQMGGNIGTAVLSWRRCHRTHPCRGVLVLPDRSCALARPVRRHLPQRDAGSSRPPRHARPLCRA